MALYSFERSVVAEGLTTIYFFFMKAINYFLSKSITALVLSSIEANLKMGPSSTNKKRE
jgi:hypothetical protein